MEGSVVCNILTHQNGLTGVVIRRNEIRDHGIISILKDTTIDYLFVIPEPTAGSITVYTRHFSGIVALGLLLNDQAGEMVRDITRRILKFSDGSVHCVRHEHYFSFSLNVSDTRHNGLDDQYEAVVLSSSELGNNHPFIGKFGGTNEAFVTIDSEFGKTTLIWLERVIEKLFEALILS